MKPQMAEPFTIEKLVELMDQAGVGRVVVVPPSWPGESQRLHARGGQAFSRSLSVHEAHPCEERPQAAALLAERREQPGMLGVRLTFLGPARHR